MSIRCASAGSEPALPADGGVVRLPPTAPGALDQLSSRQVEQLNIYLDYLLEINKGMNLTGRRCGILMSCLHDYIWGHGDTFFFFSSRQMPA